VVIAKQVGALEDELESRIALAGALIQRGDPVGRDEAEKHLQITRDEALEKGLDSMHMAALVGQAGVLAKKGQTQAALDRCLEIANVAVSKQDLPRYVAAVSLMSSIYEQKGDLASAYRTFAEAHASLREKLGDQAKDVIRPPMSAFADRIGHDKFAEIAEAVNKSERARQMFRRRP
jgi:ATP/maltotriose-dependent transcriptional regulator MalT